VRQKATISESNNLAIKGVAHSLRDKGRHIITQVTEHNAVLDTCRQLESEGFRISRIAVSSSGVVNLEELRRSFASDTILVTMMAANNELGTIQPIQEISNTCRKHNVLFHTDAAQAAGKLPIDMKAKGIDLLSVTAHKMYGPKGVGALIIRNRSPRTRLQAIIHGGGHERGFRSGTLNVPGIVGFGVAAEICHSEMQSEAGRLASLRNELEGSIRKAIKESTVNAADGHRLPHVSSITFKGVEAEALLLAMPDIALSTGSACTSAAVEPSHVLRAIGLSETDSHRTVRFALGRFNNKEDIDYVVQRISETVRQLREFADVN
jgi:cysteine desulfurase